MVDKVLIFESCKEMFWSPPIKPFYIDALSRVVMVVDFKSLATLRCGFKSRNYFRKCWWDAEGR